MDIDKFNDTDIIFDEVLEEGFGSDIESNSHGSGVDSLISGLTEDDCKGVEASNAEPFYNDEQDLLLTPGKYVCQATQVSLEARTTEEMSDSIKILLREAYTPEEFLAKLKEDKLESYEHLAYLAPLYGDYLAVSFGDIDNCKNQSGKAIVANTGCNDCVMRDGRRCSLLNNRYLLTSAEVKALYKKLMPLVGALNLHDLGEYYRRLDQSKIEEMVSPSDVDYVEGVNADIKDTLSFEYQSSEDYTTLDKSVQELREKLLYEYILPADYLKEETLEEVRDLLDRTILIIEGSEEVNDCLQEYSHKIIDRENLDTLLRDFISQFIVRQYEAQRANVLLEQLGSVAFLEYLYTQYSTSLFSNLISYVQSRVQDLEGPHISLSGDLDILEEYDMQEAPSIDKYGELLSRESTDIDELLFSQGGYADTILSDMEE